MTVRSRNCKQPSFSYAQTRFDHGINDPCCFPPFPQWSVVGVPSPIGCWDKWPMNSLDPTYMIDQPVTISTRDKECKLVYTCNNPIMVLGGLDVT